MSATEVENLAGNSGGDRYFDHLAEVCVLRGLVQLTRRADSDGMVHDEDCVREVSAHFTNGFIDALQHNIFLLDSLIEDMQAALAGNTWLSPGLALPLRQRICELVCSLWQSSSIKGESTVSLERMWRIQQDINETHRGTLLGRLRDDPRNPSVA
jgi:hypothetical protein